MKQLATLVAFRELCHQYFTCYYFATVGLKNVAEKFSSTASGPKSKLTLGYGPPNEGKQVSVVNLQQAVRSSAENGVYSDMLAKSLIVMIYSEWQEHYRKHVADEIGVEKMDLQCDLMHDLSIVRYWTQLRHSTVDDKIKKIRVLDWQFQQGSSFTITRDMFSRLSSW